MIWYNVDEDSICRNKVLSYLHDRLVIIRIKKGAKKTGKDKQRD